MKLEYLTEINPDFPEDELIRLYDFDQTEARKFQDVIDQEILKKGNSIDLTTLNFIHRVNCSLTLKLGDQDLGVQKIKNDKFDCELTNSSYREMIGLIQPFVDEDSNGYQWLYDIDPKISKTELLFSPGGTW